MTAHPVEGSEAGMIAALILAGEGTRGLAEQWLALRGAGLDPLRIAVGKGGGAAASASSGLSRENFVVDRSRAGTPFSAMQAGLRALLAADDWDAVVVQPLEAAPPHPSVVLALLARLADGDAGAVRPAHRRRAGFPVVMAREAAEALLDVDPRRRTLEALLAALEEAGAVAPLEVYTPEVLGPRAPRRRRGGK
jgi:CTP:molybdopterin cytidylyltransferase MocA